MQRLPISPNVGDLEELEGECYDLSCFVLFCFVLKHHTNCFVKGRLARGRHSGSGAISDDGQFVWTPLVEAVQKDQILETHRAEPSGLAGTGGGR